MIWKHSKLRFYLLNALWNYRFWLHAEKVYKEHAYEVEDGFDMNNVDIFGKIITNKKKMKRKRFVGYMYKGKLYLDNPGLREFVDRETWNAWREKGITK